MKVQLLHGDCLDKMRTIEEGAVDGGIMDPPYEISFMSKGWDGTGIAYSQDLWTNVRRTLKPGGIVKVFGATRTFHRIAQAMEKAGFTISGVDAWVYGSGFPKSMNIKKQILKMKVDEDGSIAEIWDGWGTALKPAWEPVLIATKPEA